LWLQARIARYPHTVILISHDRDLLDTAVDWVLHLEGRKLTLYRGGYTAFERQRPERQALYLNLAKKQEAQRRRLSAFIDRFRAKATKARQAQSRLKLLAKLEPITAVIAEEVRPIEIPPPAKPLAPRGTRGPPGSLGVELAPQPGADHRGHRGGGAADRNPAAGEAAVAADR